MLALLFGLNTGKMNIYFNKDPFGCLITLLYSIFMSFIESNTIKRVFGENDNREISDNL